MELDSNLGRAIEQVRTFIRRQPKTPVVKAFFDEPTFTATYVAHDPATRNAAIIDSVLDFDQPSGRTSFESANAIIDYVRKESLTVQWLLETHAHATVPAEQDSVAVKEPCRGSTTPGKHGQSAVFYTCRVFATRRYGRGLPTETWIRSLAAPAPPAL